jgi:hypothetical protein
MQSKEDYERLLKDIKLEFPDFEIIKKQQSSFMKFLDVCLKAITLGQMKNFMTSFITTIGNKMYVTEAWDSRSVSTKAITIRHERVHMRQSKKYGKFLFSFLYLLAPLPTVLAYYRTLFEKEAYAESLKAYHEYYGTKFFTQALKNDIVSHFTSAEYVWMWPWKNSIEKWYDDVIADITKNSHQRK